MTKEEIKKETLRLMFAVEELGALADTEGVDDYLDKMDGSIVRAVARICQAKKAGLDRFKILVKVQGKDESQEAFAAREGYTVDEILEGIDLGNNVLSVDRVSFSGNTYWNNIGYDMIDYKTIKLEIPKFKDGQKFVVLYYPAMVELPTSDDIEITTLRQDVQAIIPYFVKSELFEEDEPQMARQARSTFEQMLASVEMNTQTVQQQVIDVWSGLKWH